MHKLTAFYQGRSSGLFYECEKNICFCVCASVSLFDINGHKERKISRRKISLYMKEIYKDIVIENGRMSFILCGDRAVSSFVFKVDNNNNNNNNISDHKRKNDKEKENKEEKE